MDCQASFRVKNAQAIFTRIHRNTISNLKSDLFEGINAEEFMYLVHSFYAEHCAEEIATTQYGLTYASALKKDNFYGVQFHPEADPEGMTEHFKSDELREEIIKKHGEDKYHGMMRDLRLPDRIAKTHDVVIPSFLERAIEALNEKKTELLIAV